MNAHAGDAGPDAEELGGLFAVEVGLDVGELRRERGDERGTVLAQPCTVLGQAAHVVGAAGVRVEELAAVEQELVVLEVLKVGGHRHGPAVVAQFDEHGPVHDREHVERQALLLAVGQVDDDAGVVGGRRGHLEPVAKELGEGGGGQRGLLGGQRLERRRVSGDGVRRGPLERGRDGAHVQHVVGEADHEEEGVLASHTRNLARAADDTVRERGLHVVVLLEADAVAEAEHGQRKVVLVRGDIELFLVEHLYEAPVRERHVPVHVGGVRDGLGRKWEEVARACWLLRELAVDARVPERTSAVLECQQPPVLPLCEARIDAEHVVARAAHDVQGAVDVEAVVVLDDGLRLRVEDGARQRQAQEAVVGGHHGLLAARVHQQAEQPERHVRGVPQMHAGHKLGVVVRRAAPVPRHAEALDDDVVHKAHAHVDVDALGQVLRVDVRRAGKLERAQRAEHGRRPRVCVPAGCVWPAVDALVALRVSQEGRKKLLEEAVHGDVSVEVALQEEALHDAVAVLSVGHRLVPPQARVRHVLELDLVHVVRGCARLWQQRAFAHAFPELCRVLPLLQLGGAAVHAAINARALVDAPLVLCELLRRADAGSEDAARGAAHVGVGRLRVALARPTKALDGLLVHEGEPRLAVHGKALLRSALRARGVSFADVAVQRGHVVGVPVSERTVRRHLQHAAGHVARAEVGALGQHTRLEHARRKVLAEAQVLLELLVVDFEAAHDERQHAQGARVLERREVVHVAAEDHEVVVQHGAREPEV